MATRQLPPRDVSRNPQSGKSFRDWARATIAVDLTGDMDVKHLHFHHESYCRSYGYKALDRDAFRLALCQLVTSQGGSFTSTDGEEIVTVRWC